MLQAGHPDTIRISVLQQMLRRYQIEFFLQSLEATIPGSHWGAPEAGLIGNTLYARPDTPVHSILHEACHFICMDDRRRQQLNTDAGGSALEECAVCYLSILLADQVPGYHRTQMLADMDAWGYSFRLGSAARWFNEDAEDARQWLRDNNLVDTLDRPRWILRQSTPSAQPSLSVGSS